MFGSKKGERPTLDDAASDLFRAEAALKAAFAKFGTRLAREHGYTDLEGMDAIHRYLVDKYHWTLSYVRGLTVDDLNILLAGVDHLPEEQPGNGKAGAKTGKRARR